MKTERERHEHMLHYVCGLDFDTLKAMSDEHVKKLFLKHLKKYVKKIKQSWQKIRIALI
jgi:hypothetical protein